MLSSVCLSADTVFHCYKLSRFCNLVTVTTTCKSGADKSPPSHTKLRLYFRYCWQKWKSVFRT